STDQDDENRRRYQRRGQPLIARLVTAHRRPDKAFTPHPAAMLQCLMRRFASYQAYKPVLKS
ncbi:hypothetical protein ACNEN1_003976, partial [Escherichia coli]